MLSPQFACPGSAEESENHAVPDGEALSVPDESLHPTRYLQRRV